MTAGGVALEQSMSVCACVCGCSDMGDRAASGIPPYSYDASTPGQHHEGEDESSHNDAVSHDCLYAGLQLLALCASLKRCMLFPGAPV